MAILRPPKFTLRDMMEMAKWLQEQQIEAGLGNPDFSDYILSSTAAGARSWVRRYDQWPALFRGSSNQSLSTSAVTIDLDTTDLDPGVHYDVAADAVQVEVAGYYWIDYNVYASVDSTGGSTQCNILTSLRKNGSVINGSYAAAYIEETSLPDVSCGKGLPVLLDAGDVVDIRAQLSAAVDVSTVADRCSLAIMRVR